jgi:signal transduction histidine kinase
VHALKGAGEDIAHDIRTPLASVRARLERGREHAESRDQLLAVVEQSIAGIDQALASAAALLRIAEIEHSQRYAGFAPFDLAEIVGDAAETYGPVAEDKGIRLTLDAAPAAQILGDRDLMLELVVNLVDNAVKFTPPGGSVQVDLTATQDGLLLRVADSGPGIPKDEIGLVLRRFYRSDKSRSSKGFGLGLSLVAAIAGLHGFRLTLQNAQPGCIVELRCWRDADPRQHAVTEIVPAEPGTG